MKDVNFDRPVPWVRERDVDLLLAESLSTQLDFASWILRQIQNMQAGHELKSCRARVSFFRTDAAPEGTGETDVLAQVRWANDEDGLLSIENKIQAPPQPQQAVRHGNFIREQGCRFGATLVVAPASWIDGHQEESGLYDKAITLEAIADWHDRHGDAAGKWRGKVLRQATEQRTVLVPAPDLDAWCEDFARAIASSGIFLEPQRRGRTAADRLGKPGRFVWCASDTLGGEVKATMCFKHATANHKGRVSIDTELIEGDPQHDHFRAEATRSGFATRVTAASYLIIEVAPSAAHRFNMLESVAEQSEAVEALAEAARELQDWWNSLVA